MKKSKIIITVLTVISLFLFLIIGAVVGAGYFFVKSIEESLKSRNIVVENMKTGELTTIPVENSYGFPAISSSGDEILYTKTIDSTDLLLLHNHSLNKVDTLVRSNMRLSPAEIIGDDAYFYIKTDSTSRLCAYRSEQKTVDTLSPFFDAGFDTKLSPSGRVIAKTAAGSTGHQELFLYIPQKDKNIEMTKSNSFLNQISTLCWIDSSRVAFISFLTIYVMNVETGSMDRELELTGLTNFTELFVDPTDRKHIYLKARDAAGDLSFQIYQINMIKGTCEVWREGESMFTMGFKFSADGSSLIHTSNE